MGTFLQKMVYTRVKGWTPRVCLSVKNLWVPPGSKFHPFSKSAPYGIVRIALNVLYGFLRRYFVLFHTNLDIFETAYFVTQLRVQPRPQGAFPWLWRWGGKRPWHRPPNTQNLRVYLISVRSRTINKWQVDQSFYQSFAGLGFPLVTVTFHRLILNLFE